VCAAWLLCLTAHSRCCVLPAGAPTSLEVSEIPKHKKNPAVGTKKLLQLNKVCESGSAELFCFLLSPESSSACDVVPWRLRHACKRAQAPLARPACLDKHIPGSSVWLHALTRQLLCWYLQVWLDQADGQVLTEGEEVTLMDWGNAFIRVSQHKPNCCCCCCCKQTGCSAETGFPVLWRLWTACCACVCVCCAQ
jgi:hypothetical protein